MFEQIGLFFRNLSLLGIIMFLGMLFVVNRAGLYYSRGYKLISHLKKAKIEMAKEGSVPNEKYYELLHKGKRYCYGAGALCVVIVLVAFYYLNATGSMIYIISGGAVFCMGYLGFVIGPSLDLDPF